MSTPWSLNTQDIFKGIFYMEFSGFTIMKNLTAYRTASLSNLGPKTLPIEECMNNKTEVDVFMFYPGAPVLEASIAPILHIIKRRLGKV